ncbi:MAG: hypothetical protein WC356_05120 [Candidatus Micrarchaeia archaeon]
MTVSNELQMNGIRVKLAWVKWVIEIAILVGGLMWGFQSLRADVKILDGRMQGVERKVERMEVRIDQHMQRTP